MSTLNVKGMAAGFIAPEIMSKITKPNINTDVYSLGFSIFEILSDNVKSMGDVRTYFQRCSVIRESEEKRKARYNRCVYYLQRGT